LPLVVLVAADIGTGRLALAQSMADARRICPSSNPQTLPLEATTIQVDSILSEVSLEELPALVGAQF
jgi:hypothetical protein